MAILRINLVFGKLINRRWIIWIAKK